MGGKGTNAVGFFGGGILSSDKQCLFRFLQQHFSVFDPLFIGVVRPWFLPVCREEVDPVCWSPIGQDILSHWHLLEIIMLFCRWENQVENWDKHVCISPVGIFHHMDRTLSWRSSQNRTWSISRIGMMFLGPPQRKIAENFHHKMVQKGLELEFLDQNYLFLAEYFLSGIGGGVPPTPLNEKSG